MKISLREWQQTIKPISNLIVQASAKDGSDSWQEWPIGMSWQYGINYTKGDFLQIGNHNILVLSVMRKETDQTRRPSGINRLLICENLSRNGIGTSNIDHEIYFSILSQCKFVVSPEGNGIDCHRHYEALLAGCIPIMERNPLTEEKYKGCPVLWTVDYSEITPEYLKEKYAEMIDKEYDFSCLFLSNYTKEEQKQIKDSGNYWMQVNLKSDWYKWPMNIVYAFVGKLPSYCIHTVYQTRLFYDGPIYFITNDLESKYIPKLKEYNVSIIDYMNVVDNNFNSLVEQKYKKFCIIEDLPGREKLFIHAFERFYLLHNLMIQRNLKDVFFMELDNLIYDDPTLWLESFSKKDMAYMFDNVMRCSSGISYIKNTDILREFLEFSNDFISFSDKFIDEMTSLFLFWHNNKERVQLLPIHWNDSRYPVEVYETFSSYNNTIFDALSIGIFIAGIDPHHSKGVLTKGMKSSWGLVDYTVYSYKWEIDANGRNIPYINDGTNWLRINNLHVHSKELQPVLSVKMPPKRIGFLENKLTLRGTSVALYDYAHYNETLLNNKSIVITRRFEVIKDTMDADIKAYEKFSSRFNIVYYENPSDIDAIIEEYKLDILFIEKSGNASDKLITEKCKTIVHCVFETHEPHGSYYCGLSEWLNERNLTNIPVLHYMLHVYNTDTNLRANLGIPENAIVFGSYGCRDGYVQYIIDAINDIISDPDYSNIYFIFMNVTPFTQNYNNIRFLQGTDNMEIKRMFINTCDAMVYSREHGETFGLACGEFSICNKPIIAHNNPKDKFHLQTLRKDAILHSNYSQCYHILTNFDKYKKDVSNNGYKKYTPEFAMKQFADILDIL